MQYPRQNPARSPAPTEFITEHCVGALCSTSFSGLHGFPRKDNKCVCQRGVIY